MLKKIGDIVQVTIARRMTAELAAGLTSLRSSAIADAAMINESREDSSAPAAKVLRQPFPGRKTSAGMNLTR